MKLVTYDDGKVGRIDGDEIVRLDVPTMRDYFARAGADDTGERTPLADATLRAPIVPKKFFHTAGNFREHEEESKNVNWSHEIAPWIVFFQNVDAIVGPDEPVVYPEHLTEELDYELELAVIIGKSGKWFGPEEAMDYVAGYVIFNDITARDIQRREMRSGVFSFCKAIDTFCPLRPWIATADEIPDPHDLAMPVRGDPARARLRGVRDGAPGEHVQSLAHRPSLRPDRARVRRPRRRLIAEPADAHDSPGRGLQPRGAESCARELRRSGVHRGRRRARHAPPPRRNSRGRPPLPG